MMHRLATRVAQHMNLNTKLRTVAIFFGAMLSAADTAYAQELEPRVYRALPSGLDFLVFSYGLSSGNVVADATAPIEDLSAEIHSTTLTYIHTFGLLGRSSSVTLSAPYVFVSASGRLRGDFLEGSRSDWADARARLTVNILGGPALPMAEFAGLKQGRTLGFGLTVAMPTGQYDSDKVINFGANRWGFKPELGYSSRRGKWILDAAAGAWLFTANNDGAGGTTHRQDAIGSLQGHVSRSFANGMWLALDANYFWGGRSSVDGQEGSDLQKNSRLGLTWSIPLAKRHSLRLAAHTGAFTRVGADFDIASLSYQFRLPGK
jgi:hypothetical protein